MTARPRSKHLQERINAVKCPKALRCLDSSLRRAPLNLPRYLNQDHHRDLHQREIETEDVTPALSVYRHVHPLMMAPASPESGRPEVGSHIDNFSRIQMILDICLDHRSYHLCILLHRSKVILGQLAAGKMPGHRSRRWCREGARNESRRSWMRRSSHHLRHWHTGFCPKSLT